MYTKDYSVFVDLEITINPTSDKPQEVCTWTFNMSGVLINSNLKYSIRISS